MTQEPISKEEPDIRTVFMHRSAESLKYMPHCILRNDKAQRDDAGTIVGKVPTESKNQGIKPLGRYYIYGVLIAFIYEAGTNQFAIYMPNRRTPERRLKAMRMTNRFFADDADRTVTAAGVASERFMLDESNCNSKAKIPYTGGKTIRDLWNFAKTLKQSSKRNKRPK